MDNVITLSKKELIEKLWSEDYKIKEILENSKGLENARDFIFDYLNKLERSYFNINSNNNLKDLHILEKNNAKECIRFFKNIIRTENEKLTNFSALKNLFNLAKNKETKITEGFLLEFIFIFKGINGRSNIQKETYEDQEKGRKAAINRSNYLDKYAKNMDKYFKKYKTGYELVEKRNKLKKEILNYFNATKDDWIDYIWQLKHIIKDMKTLSSLINLEKNEIKGLESAEKYKIPFQITPYYLSLFNKNGRSDYDGSIRAQVIPGEDYCLKIVENRKKNLNLDFMQEELTSPIDCITRRYPKILILKPFNSCPQICVYCQRNWEAKSLDEAKIKKESIEKAIGWIKNNENISEVLITGGDPLTLDNEFLDHLIDELSKIGHIERIRIGTRVLVTLPFRIDTGFIEILKKHHELGKREICIVTHFEHSAEVTPEVLEAIKKIRELGINIYNQEVFTYYNSKKYETAFLRKTLKLSGVDPYYTFNTKGKEETIDFRVPIARIEQERKEEARLLPGVVRTDEPVFNVPKLGKSHLRAWQDHEPIMVFADGKRGYRFYSWESKLTLTKDYIYTDVSIYDYLKRLFDDNVDINEYKSIWYYF